MLAFPVHRYPFSLLEHSMEDVCEELRELGLIHDPNGDPKRPRIDDEPIIDPEIVAVLNAIVGIFNDPRCVNWMTFRIIVCTITSFVPALS
jgi:hypothetical protein